MSVPEAPRAPAAQTTGVAIAAVGVCKTVKGGKQVLHNVSVAVQPGELVAIVGGSGTGKTMLLEALAGVRPAEQAAGTASTGTYWLYLAIFAVVFFAGAWVTLVRKCRRSTR